MPLSQILTVILTILFWIALIEGVIALTIYLGETFYRFFKDSKRDQKRPPANSPDL